LETPRVSVSLKRTDDGQSNFVKIVFPDFHKFWYWGTVFKPFDKRGLASRPGFLGTVVGSDLSASLIETAKDITAGHTKIESTVRYLGIDVDDALTLAEQVDV
jgi:hypothetical protein